MLHRYISISPKWKLVNNSDVTAFFTGDNEICQYRLKSASVKDIDIADSLGQKYQYRQRRYSSTSRLYAPAITPPFHAF